MKKTAKEEAATAAKFMANRMAYVWGMPEMQVFDHEALQTECETICDFVIDNMDDKIDAAKVEIAYTKRKRPTSATRRRITASYMYIYAKGEMRRYLCDVSKHKFADSTLYYFEQLVKVHKNEKSPEPVCYKYVEDVQELLGSSDKTARRLMSVYNTLGEEYTPVYRDVKNSIEYKKAEKKLNAALKKYAELTLSQAIIQKRTLKAKQEFKKKESELQARNEQARLIRDCYLAATV